MLAKNWKKILLIILVIFCLINAVSKILKLITFDNTVEVLKEKFIVLKNENE